MAGGGRQTASGGALTKSMGMAGPQDVRVRTIWLVQSDTEGSRKSLIGHCFPLAPNDHGDLSSFGGAQVKGIEGFSSLGQFQIDAKDHLREAFDVSLHLYQVTRFQTPRALQF
ncbi:MAG: hypothetical protein ACSHWX_03635 [Maritalea sp.]